MWKLVICFLIATLNFISVVNATDCLESGTTEQLKQKYDILISGKVISKKKSKKITNSQELKISVIKVISGELITKEIKGYEIEPRHKAMLKKEYNVGKEYYFPVIYVGKGKNKEPEALVQPSGCPDFILSNK